MSAKKNRIGVVRCEDLKKALIKLGGIPTYKGGEVIIKLYFTEITDAGETRRSAPSIIIGRTDFSRVMMKNRVYPILILAGIHPDELHKLLDPRKY